MFPVVELGGQPHDVPHFGGTQNVGKIVSNSSTVGIILFDETILNQRWDMLQLSSGSQWTGRYLGGIITDMTARSQKQKMILFLMRIA